MDEGLRITTTIDERGWLVVTVAGEIDLATAPQLAACLVDAADRDVAADLSAVTFLDSSGLSALVAGSRAVAAGGHILRTFGERETVLRVLEISGLDVVFHETNDDTGA
jgi:anti-sigma B factor antagonist